MNLLEEILKENSKIQCNKIVEWVGNSRERFNELFNLFLNDEYRIVQRAALPVSYCAIKYPDLLQNKFSALISNLMKTENVAVKRNTIRILQHVKIPVKFHGEVMNLCFIYIQSPEEPVAIKAFSLTVLNNLSKKYPEILPELKLIIEEQLPHQTAAYKSRARSILQ